MLQLGGDSFSGGVGARRGLSLACLLMAINPGFHAARLPWTAFEGMAEGLRQNGDTGEPIGEPRRDALMVDDGISPWSSKESKRSRSFPGSRPAIRKRARIISRRSRQDPKELDDWGRVRCASLALLHARGDGNVVRGWVKSTTSGTRQVLADADMALTQPGTNTLELLHMAVPASSSYPSPFCGISRYRVSRAGHRAPVIGGMFKDLSCAWRPNIGVT